MAATSFPRRWMMIRLALVLRAVQDLGKRLSKLDYIKAYHAASSSSNPEDKLVVGLKYIMYIARVVFKSIPLHGHSRGTSRFGTWAGRRAWGPGRLVIVRSTRLRPNNRTEDFFASARCRIRYTKAGRTRSNDRRGDR